ncbi:MAG: phytanoyl-CoA dioxygenase family protein [Pseudomonas sp.]|uniref:phytanoyl-CoA dioxygenase family protein n=1 Tax=Pseudomonas sp. TaxID=306 RepID=UPI002FCBD54B
MSTRTMSFNLNGYAVVPELVTEGDLALARSLVGRLTERYRQGDVAALLAGVSISDAGRRNPQRNPGVDPEQWTQEPFIIGDLLALEPCFARLFSRESIWNCVAKLLDCMPSELLFHFSNLTRKPGMAGPAIGWHRDAQNNYFASEDGRTVRVLIALEHMSTENGGTAVVPRSHMDALAGIEDALCPEVSPGSCLVLHSATLHGGTPNRSGRERDVIVMQFGLRSSSLRCQASECMALSSRDELLVFASNLPDNQRCAAEN